jgi:hypothetical protein
METQVTPDPQGKHALLEIRVIQGTPDILDVQDRQVPYQILSFLMNYKQGLGDLGEPTKGWGLSAVFDFDGWFMRIARDQKQNFAPINATRVSLGVRF